MFRRKKPTPTITVDQLKQKIQNKEALTLLDVRNPNEWHQTGIIPGSVTIPMHNVSTQIQHGLNLKENEPVVVICRSGARSASVTKFLINELGINALNLQGGVLAWNRAGEEFERV